MRVLCTLLVLTSWTAAARAADWPVPGARPKIGLVLSGGGARGAAHIGVLKVLEAHRIPIDYIAATSMGALVGGLYASGMTPAQLDSVIVTTDWMETLADNIPRGDRSFRRKRDDDLWLVKHKPGLRGGQLLFPPGLLDAHRVDLLLKRLSLCVTTVRDFDRLSIPYRAVAADIVTGDRVVLDHGDLALAMRASMAIPAAFAPREIDGRLLVDGGIVDNLPIDLVRQMGADIVIAVDIGTPPSGREHLYSVPAIAAQLTTIAGDRNRNRQVATLGPHDILMLPDLGTITTASFGRAAEAIPIGERSADSALTRLAPLALSPADYEAYQAARAARAAARGIPRIDSVRIVNRSRVADGVIANRVPTTTGVPLDWARMEAGLDRIYGLELFESVYYDVVPTPSGNTLCVTVRERAWGPDYVQAGVSVLEDFEHPNFNVALAYSRTAVDRLNGEWRTGVQIGQEPAGWTELFQPLDHGLKTFVDVQPLAGERNVNVFDATGHKVAELVMRRYGATLAAGREFGTWSELRAGVLREGGRTDVTLGEPALPLGRYDTGEAFGQFWIDKLDELPFPHRGASLRARYAAGLTDLGSGSRYEQWDVEATAAATRGELTGSIGGLFGTTLHSNAPLERMFCLGGLGQLSGLQQDERFGQHALLLRGMAYARLGDFPLAPVYAGCSVEYGDVFQERPAIGLADATAAGSVFFGLETLFGPLCVAFGRADGGRNNCYFTLGQPLGGHRPGFRVH